MLIFDKVCMFRFHYLNFFLENPSLSQRIIKEAPKELNWIKINLNSTCVFVDVKQAGRQEKSKSHT